MEENQTNEQLPIQSNESNNQGNTNNIQQPQQPESKTLIGALCGVFLGLVGLIIGLLLFKENTMERQTFIKGWIWAFIISAAVSMVLCIVLVSVVACVPISYEINY